MPAFAQRNGELRSGCNWDAINLTKTGDGIVAATTVESRLSAIASRLDSTSHVEKCANVFSPQLVEKWVDESERFATRLDLRLVQQREDGSSGNLPE